MNPMRPSVRPRSTIRNIGPVTSSVSDKIPKYNAGAWVIGEPALSVTYVPITLVLEMLVLEKLVMEKLVLEQHVPAKPVRARLPE